MLQLRIEHVSRNLTASPAAKEFFGKIGPDMVSFMFGNAADKMQLKGANAVP